MVVLEGSLDVLDFLGLKRDFESFVKVEFELCEVELLAHIDIPVRLWNHTRDQPASFIEVFFIH